MRSILALVLVVVALPVHAADRYVRQGASGNGSGTDWTNAYPSLPGTLVRGDTYYIGDGSYGSYTFNTPNSGTSVVTLKKATAANHGTSVGWSATYGDGQAVFVDVILTTDNVVFDGGSRNESNWADGTSYGFRAKSFYSNALSFGHCADNVTVRYVEVGGPYSESYNNLDRSFYLGGFSETCDNWTISRNFIHNTGEVNMPGVTNVTIEYNWFGPTWGKEIIRGQVRATNVTIRHNVFRNGCRDEQEPGSGCTAEVGLFANQGDSPAFGGFRAYGNVTWKTINMHKTDASYLVQAADCLIYNNTIYDNSASGTSQIKCDASSGSAVRNNIFYLPNGMGSGCQAAVCDNNSTYTSSPPFLNIAAGDFRLTGTLGGVALIAPFNVDKAGNARGADGAWDRGAYEYVIGGAALPLPAPTNLRVSGP